MWSREQINKYLILELHNKAAPLITACNHFLKHKYQGIQFPSQNSCTNKLIL